MNYQELQQQIADYMHRSDLSDKIPGFIESARARLNRDLRVREMIETLTLTPPTNPWDLRVDVPGFIEARDLSAGRATGRYSLELVGRNEMSRWSGQTTGVYPLFYSVDGYELETQPGGTGTEFRLIYYREIEALVNDEDRTPTLDAYPYLWLYGSLIEAHSYTQDMELRGAATEVFTSEIRQANQATAQAESGASLSIKGASQWL
jgi:hypothetical protein